MGQPVRNIIKEAHPELSAKPFYTLIVDGNNLLFRSYYATAYNGNLMKNSKGMPTNALYGFINMINKILNEEKPEYVMVAFDKGHNFRKDLYDNYNMGEENYLSM